MKFPSILLPTGALTAAAIVLPGCSTPGGGSSGGRLNPNHPAVAARNAQISAEPRGNHYIGRRYWLEGTRFWGFVRKPGQTWRDAKLVMMNESVKHTPDRLPEVNPGGKAHGFDHNYEYRLTGRFTGARIYDPNSDQILPEFLLTGYEVISRRPGFLFHPQEDFGKRVPKAPY